MSRLPGQMSVVSLLIAGTWTLLTLFILIAGHLVWLFITYGIFTNTDALKDLESFLPILSQNQMYLLAGLAIVMDIWIIFSHQKERKKHLQR